MSSKDPLLGAVRTILREVRYLVIDAINVIFRDIINEELTGEEISKVWNTGMSDRRIRMKRAIELASPEFELNEWEKQLTREGKKIDAIKAHWRRTKPSGLRTSKDIIERYMQRGE